LICTLWHLKIVKDCLDFKKNLGWLQKLMSKSKLWNQSKHTRKKCSQKKSVPGTFSLHTFSLVCIFLQNSRCYPNNLKCVMYIRTILFTRYINFFPSTFHIDIMLHANYVDRKCCKFSTPQFLIQLRHQEPYSQQFIFFLPYEWAH